MRTPSCKDQSTLRAIDLPHEFEDVEGFLQADLRAIVTMLTQRANERLLLTRRESTQLRNTLWNSLTDALNASMAPLTAENR